MSRSFSANAPATASRHNIGIQKGRLRCRRGLEQKRQDVSSSHDYLEEEDGNTSRDAYALVSSQSVACEVVWDCVSPGPPVSIDDCDGSSTPGEGNAIRQLRKRPSTQRTPARSVHVSAAKAKKTAGLDVKANAISGAKCSARLLFFKNAVPLHDKDVTPSVREQGEMEAMDIMDLSPIACLNGVEAEVAAADVTAATDAVPLSTSVASVTAVSPLTTPKMNQSFSCKNSANKSRCNDRMDSFDDDSLFSESIIQSTQAIEEALFDKSKNKFISPAAVGKALGKIQPVLFNGKLAEVKQCNTPPSHGNNLPKGANGCTGRMSSSNWTENLMKSSQKQENLMKSSQKQENLMKSSQKRESNLMDNKIKDGSIDTNLQKKNQQKEESLMQVDASRLLSKPLLSKRSKDNFGDVIVTATKIDHEPTNKQNFTSKSSFAIGGTAIADKSTLTKVATPAAGGRNGNNQSKMPRSRSVYSAAGVKATATLGMATAVRRVNSDSAVLNFSDSDPEFDEIASSIPNNEEMLMPWSQQLLQKTRLKLNSNKSMQKQLLCIQEVLNKSIQRSEGSQGDCLNSPQPPNGLTSSTGHHASQSRSTGLIRQSITASVPKQPTSTVSPQLLDDAGFFDDGFEMEDDELNNFLSQVEEEYVSASQAGAAAGSHTTNGSAGLQLARTMAKDKVSSFNNRRNGPLSKPNDRKHRNPNSEDQIRESRVTSHTSFTKHCNASEVPINTVLETMSNPRANLDIIPPSQSDTSGTNHKCESTPNKKYFFRNNSCRTDSSGIVLKNLTVIGHTNAGSTPRSGHQRATSTTNSTSAVEGNPGVGLARPPTSTTTHSGSTATMSRSSCSATGISGLGAEALCAVPAASSSQFNVAATSRVTPSSSSLFNLPVPTTTGGGLTGSKTRYTKEQIAMKKAVAIERQKALLQRKATKGGAL